MVNNKIIFIVHGDEKLLWNIQNERFIRDTESVNEGDDETWESHDWCTDGPPIRIPRQVLQITTNDQPIDTKLGFVIGSNPDECDIFLDDQRISEMHLAVQMNLDAGTVVLRNYARHGTKISFSEQKQTKVVRSTYCLLNSETASIEFSPGLRIQIERFDDPVNWRQYLANIKLNNDLFSFDSTAQSCGYLA